MQIFRFCALLLLFFHFKDIQAQQHNLEPYIKFVAKKKKAKKQKIPKQIPKIYDCFTFFNELELLEIRLNELHDVVDYFVLVEMNETFQGNHKPLYFLLNQKKFEKFLPKIIYVGVTERIEVHNNPWEREKFQRDQIMRALKNCDDNDVIIVSDLDEILSHHAIPRIVEALNDHPIVACQLAFFVYFLNAKEKKDGGIRPFAMRYGHLKYNSIDELRKCYIFHIPQAPSKPPFIVYGAGWHFCSMGGLARFIQKLEAWSHTPENTPMITPEWKTQEFINNSVESSCEIVKIDQSFPQFVLDNFDVLRKKGFIHE